MSSLRGALASWFKALDRKDFSALLKMTDTNAELIDETTRNWIRGKAELRRRLARGS